MPDNSIRSLSRKDSAIRQASERETSGPRLDRMRLLQLKTLRLGAAEEIHCLNTSLRRQYQFAPALTRAPTRSI